jgi:hypothetical protein
VFVLNLAPFDAYRDKQVIGNRTVQQLAAETVAIIEDGCPRGTELDPDAQPFYEWSPQVDVATLVELTETGALTIRAQPSAGQITRVCRPATT